MFWQYPEIEDKAAILTVNPFSAIILYSNKLKIFLVKSKLRKTPNSMAHTDVCSFLFVIL